MVTLSNIDPLLAQAGKDNMPGIVSKIIFGYHPDVAVWPALPADGGSLELSGALVGDVVMKATKCAFVQEITEDTGSLEIKPLGETGGEFFEYNLNIIHAKVQKKILGFQNAARGQKMFFIVEDENGNFFLLGDKARGAMMQTGGDGSVTGKSGSNDRNQTSMAFKYRAPRALVYEGDTEDLLVAAP